MTTASSRTPAMPAPRMPGVVFLSKRVNNRYWIMAATKPIIRLYFAKMKGAFGALSDQEKMAFMQKDRENLDNLGMKAVTMIDCSWSNEEWDYIGVEEWPSMEAIEQRKIFEEQELDVSRYVESKTILGTPESFDAYGKN
jgi:hypothetical protein